MSRPDDEPRRLLTLDRTRPGGGEEELRIDLDAFNGNAYVSMRLWFRDRSGAWVPTRKGVTIRAREIDDAIEVLRTAGRIIEGQRPRQPRRSPQKTAPTMRENRPGFSEFDE